MCLKRPEVPDEPHGRCEACAKAGRRAYQFRLRPSATGFQISAGELSPRALRAHVGQALSEFTSRPTVKQHLVATQCELVVAKTRVESVRIAPGLASRADEVISALRAGAQRTDPAW